MYLPTNERSCCPNLPIRLDTYNFVPSRSQQKSLKRLQEVLAGKRPITLPPNVTDPFLRCIALTREGRAREASEAVIRNREDRCVENCRPTLRAQALASALCMKFLGEGEGEDSFEEESTMEKVEVNEDMHDDRGGGECQAAPAARVNTKAPPPCPLYATALDPLRCEARELDHAQAISQACLLLLPLPSLCTMYCAAVLHTVLLSSGNRGQEVLEKVRITPLDRVKSGYGGGPPPNVSSNAAFVLSAADGAQSKGEVALRLASLCSAAHAAACGGGGGGGVSCTDSLQFFAMGLPSGHLNFYVDGSVSDLVARLARMTYLEYKKKNSSTRPPPPPPLSPQELLGSGAIPSMLNSSNAKTAAEWTALALWYNKQQWEREAAGSIMLTSDPLWPDLGKDDPEGPLSDVQLSPEQKRADEEKSLAEDIDKSVKALESLLLEGIGGYSERQRARAVAAAGAGAVNPNTLLPFGPGPYSLTVILTRPHYSTEVHELYARFNMALHKGKPSSELKGNFLRHLVRSPIIPLPAWRLGAAWRATHPQFEGEFTRLREEGERKCPLAGGGGGFEFFESAQNSSPPSTPTPPDSLLDSPCTFPSAYLAELLSPLELGTVGEEGIHSKELNFEGGFSSLSHLFHTLATLLGLPALEPAEPSALFNALSPLSAMDPTVPWVLDELSLLLSPAGLKAEIDFAERVRREGEDTAKKTLDGPRFPPFFYPPPSTSTTGSPWCCIPTIPAAFLPLLSSLAHFAAPQQPPPPYHTRTATTTQKGPGDSCLSSPSLYLLATYALSLSFASTLRQETKRLWEARRLQRAWEDRRTACRSLFLELMGGREMMEGEEEEEGQTLVAAFISSVQCPAPPPTSTQRSDAEAFPLEQCDSVVPPREKSPLQSLSSAFSLLKERAVESAKALEFVELMIKFQKADEGMEDSQEADEGHFSFEDGESSDDFLRSQGLPPLKELREISTEAAKAVLKWEGVERALDEGDPPVSLTPLSPLILSHAHLSRTLLKLIDSHSTSLSWLIQSISSQQRELVSTIVPLARSPGGERLPPPPSRAWFDTWITPRPTPGARRWGVIPLPSQEAEFAALAQADAEAGFTGGGSSWTASENDGGDSVTRRRMKVSVSGGDLPFGYGTFFHEYRINGELIAVSVLDVLPTRVASVYFFYNPDYRSTLELGKLSALVEVWLAQSLGDFTAAHPELTTLLPPGLGPAPTTPYLDLNFYVHSCRAMRYKSSFQPSAIRCPVLQKWVPLNPLMLARLDQAPSGPLLTPLVPGEEESRSGSSPSQLVFHGLEAEGGGDKKKGKEEEGRAAEVMAGLLCRLRFGKLYALEELSEHSQSLCSKGIKKWLQVAGEELASRVLLDPNGCSYVGWQEAERLKKLADAEATTSSRPQV